MARAIVKKWGNSASVRIPSAILKAAQLNIEDSVELREESGRIVIEPLQRKQYDLAKLLRRIRKRNIHRAIHFGAPMGRELL